MHGFGVRFSWSGVIYKAGAGSLMKLRHRAGASHMPGAHELG